jgi:alpha-glucosidase
MGNEPVKEMDWWRNAVVYQIYPRSFQDSNNDGTGDLKGIISRLDYLSNLGIDCIWLSPFYPSPNKDFGYDISDYCNVDPLFGDLSDFDHLVSEAHKRNLKVIIDLVPNHTSNQHAWFQEALEGKNSFKRDWYVWRDPAPGGGVPNNWPSYFGGPAWTLDKESGQYYLHQFLSEQPDLNFRNPLVVEAMLDVMRFWLKRNVDGFRVDVIWLLVEAEDFADEPINHNWNKNLIERDRTIHTKIEDQPETHIIIQLMRQVLEQFSSPGREKMMIGEAYLPYDQLITYYGTKDKPECHMPFNFHLITEGLENWQASAVRKIVDEYEQALPADCSPNWVLGNHDKFRFASRIGSEQARVATMLLLTLRGSPTWYYGDEIGMLNGEIPADKIVDPRGIRQPDVPSEQRDPERTPMQWDSTAYSGFSNTEPWLPISANYAAVNVVAQEQQPQSMLNLVKLLLKLRKQYKALSHGSYCAVESSRLVAPSCDQEKTDGQRVSEEDTEEESLFIYIRQFESERIAVILNFSNSVKTHNLKGHCLASTYMDHENLSGAEFTVRANEGLAILLA